MLRTMVGGLELQSPLLTGSGTFGHDPAALAFLNPGDLGALVLKTVTPEPRFGNPSQRLAEFPGGVINAIGLENKGLVYWRDHVAPQLKEVPLPVVANAGGHSATDYVAMVEAFDAMDGVAAIELNLSCPNVKGGTQFSTDAQALEDVVRACRKTTDKPLWVKLSPNVTSIVPFAKAAEASGANALTVCNTLVGLLVDWRKRKPVIANGTGGLSGPAAKPVAMRLVWEASSAVKIPVIASGGASTAEDVLEFIVSGASAVQIGTASFRRPNAISEIATDLRHILGQEKLTLDELRGTLIWPH
ncbi:MAG: dihydroorotate dehydrogenase [Planctomycetota bacterium]|nr:dihydroorotate dehydrogenase [Planctomycetota bacterium]MDA1112917.1 dihydroorotate dehydrogenase [Planctomycetota bacterium]